MMQLEKRILNKLIDSYENSTLLRGENKVAVHVSFAFNKKNIPQYFDESSMAYEEIHAELRQLEARGFVNIVWKNKKVDHIVQKVLLREEAIPEVYQYLKRTSKTDMEKAALEEIEHMLKSGLMPVAESFLSRMEERISAGKSVKEYMDITDLKEAGELTDALDQVEKNGEACFIREFSINHFHDSKRFETLIPKVCKIFREEVLDYENLENEELLAEYEIYDTPSYVYLKGNVQLNVQSQLVNVAAFPEGFGFALNNQNVDHIDIEAANEISSVYTIENLTTFFRFRQKNSLIIYLGGYHNHVRRALLKKVYKAFPAANYYHFGDIDAGGFQIYYHLKEKTKIPFSLYRMGLQTLKDYEEYGRKLTENDKKRLKHLSDTRMGTKEKECVDYMLEHNVKLEQECVQCFPEPEITPEGLDTKNNIITR